MAGLPKLLELKAPKCMKDQKLENYFNRIIAVNASKNNHHFFNGKRGIQMLTDETSKFTSHLQELFIQTIRFLEAGIKPVFVFDGELCDSEKQEHSRRSSRQGDAIEDLMEVKRQRREECMKLLELMGVPVIEAPSEADAECADLCKYGKVYAVVSEDMDCLAFGVPRYLHLLVDPGSKEIAVKEFELVKILGELNITMDQFIDFRILSGCDYCQTIKGIGGQTALKLICQHGSLENMLARNKKRYRIPEDWSYQRARNSFKEPQVFPENEEPELLWSSPDEKGLMDFLVEENGFNTNAVIKAIEKVKPAKRKPSVGCCRMQSFKSVGSDSFPYKWKRTKLRDGLIDIDSVIRRNALLTPPPQTTAAPESSDTELQMVETPVQSGRPTSRSKRRDGPNDIDSVIGRNALSTSSPQTTMAPNSSDTELQVVETPIPSDRPTSRSKRRGGLKDRVTVIRRNESSTSSPQTTAAPESSDTELQVVENPGPSGRSTSRSKHKDGLNDMDSVIRRKTSSTSPSLTTSAHESSDTELLVVETTGPSDCPTSKFSEDPQPGDPTDLTGNPAKVGAVLHPIEGLWFDHPSVVHEVSHSFETFFDGPYTCWSKTLIPVRRKWWLYFRKQFSWDPSVAQLVKEAYEKKLKRRLSGMLSKIGLDPNYRADWCPPEVRAELMRLRASDEFKQKSQQCSANKKSCQKAGRFHCQGSISTTHLKRKLAVELRREPTAAEVYKKSHQTKDGSFIDTTSAAVWEEYERLKRVHSESETRDEALTNDEIFFQALGGWSDKGTIYGLGSAAEIYYKRDKLSSSSRRSRFDRVMELENKIEDMNVKHQKEKDKQQEVITSQQKQIDQTTKDVKSLQTRLEAMSQFLTGCTPRS